jgi:nucleotide-binding universal stress UspA family protein
MALLTRSRRWRGFRSVLCPVDFSEPSRLALRRAEAIARRGTGSLTVFYANDPLLIAAAAAALHDRDIARRSAGELRAFIDATLSPESRERLLMRSGVSTGDPAREILKAASRRRSDLIVLGTHGLTGADRLLMGSTTLNILRRSALPVLAVPWSDQSATVSESWPGEKIVAALDLNNGSARDVDIAARVAHWFGSSLLLLHVVAEIAAPAWLRGDLSAHDRIRLARAQQQIDKLAGHARRQVQTETRIVCGRVADEIAAFAAAERVGLVLTALADRTGWFGSRRGAISYHVLSHGVAPVLAYPPRWQPR